MKTKEMIDKHQMSIEILEAIQFFENVRDYSINLKKQLQPFLNESTRTEHRIDIYNRCIQRLCLRLYYHENPQMKVKL